jgi:precorrin-2 dehydrogenase/sirohydrochlorin ferrochelatase
MANSGAPASGSGATRAMFPLMLDVVDRPVFLIGGKGIGDRFTTLQQYGARRVTVFAAEAADFTDGAGTYHHRWPTADDFAMVRPALVFIADVAEAQAAEWRRMAQTVGALVHVQDRIPLCDFHMPAVLRRGHLQMTVSTDGVVPGLSRTLRDRLGGLFGPEWSERVDEIAEKRAEWKRDGMSMTDLAASISTFLRRRGWF